jgi:hypothetical protein
MSNLLTPPGLLAWQRGRYGGPANAPDARMEPIPDHVGAWIRTERGSRRLLPEALARRLGVPKEWKLSEAGFTDSVLKQTTSAFHWEHLSELLVCSALDIPASSDGPLHISVDPIYAPVAPVSEFSWCPPDLSIGGVWYQERDTNLVKAAAHYENRVQLVHDGLRALEVHRSNYTATHPEPKQLQLLWWEFPPEHWDEIRNGGSMNFMVPPTACIHPNSAMTEEQLVIATEFVQELVELGVLVPGSVLTNGPLFVLEKAGQPGQWRVLLDMKSDGQNLVVSNDPVFLNRTSHILDQLYDGGYSAVVDASKYFYQFKTRPEDRKYLGVQHPRNLDEFLVYAGLPMSAGNSIALSGKFGLSFIPMLKSRFRVFQGTPHANCFWTGFSETGEYDSKLGYGYVLLGPDGEPAARVWAHSDDVLLHSASYATTAKALTLFLDMAVECGLLCHPGKLTPPSQVVKYCGFMLDSIGIPTMRIPLEKRERAIAMVDYLLLGKVKTEYSRLSLYVVAGVLESLVEATPSRLGHTYLRRMHSLVHPEGSGTGASPYYTKTSLTESVLRDLRWWQTFLSAPGGRAARSLRSATLMPNWGDGSGTDAGGTLGWRGSLAFAANPLQMWMGQWSPIVYADSSNWKELMPLRLTLQNIAQIDPDQARGTTIFYFTDNYAT